VVAVFLSRYRKDSFLHTVVFDMDSRREVSNPNDNRTEWSARLLFVGNWYGCILIGPVLHAAWIGLCMEAVQASWVSTSRPLRDDIDRHLFDDLLFHLLADSTRPVHNHRLVAGLGTEITRYGNHASPRYR
jgi:hypothetical protein